MRPVYTAEELIHEMERLHPEPLHGPEVPPERVLWDRAQRSLIVSTKREIERQRKPKGSA